MRDSWDQNRVGYTYGLYGTPTSLELAARICELESGAHTILTPGGQAAISLINLALLQAGDHMLVPSSVYFPNRQLAVKLLARFGVTTTFYEPTIGAGISALLQENTGWFGAKAPARSPWRCRIFPPSWTRRTLAMFLWSSITPGPPACCLTRFITAWDVTMQAVTKYIGGHSDLLLGSVTVRDAELYHKLGAAQQNIGCAVSPDDCSLALRGLQTLAVRLSHIEASRWQLPNGLPLVRKSSVFFIQRSRPAPATNFGSATFLAPPAYFRLFSSRDRPKSKYFRLSTRCNFSRWDIAGRA